jgi:REP element-mobilizing transposase RayT
VKTDVARSAGVPPAVSGAFAWCVMPNHVHVLARLFPGVSLASVLHSWKSFTAKRANTMLHRGGAFWQREYYDHLIRDESEFEYAVQYVFDNPAKAGLSNWPWVWVWEQDAPTTAAEDGGATK